LKAKKSENAMKSRVALAVTDRSDPVLVKHCFLTTEKSSGKTNISVCIMKIRLYESLVLAKLPRPHEAQTRYIIVTAANIEMSVASISDRRGNP